MIGLIDLDSLKNYNALQINRCISSSVSLEFSGEISLYGKKMHLSKIDVVLWQFQSRHHVFDKLLVIDQAVSIFICILDHLLNVLFAEFLSELDHDVAQLVPIDKAISIFVGEFELLFELLLLIRLLHLAGHQIAKFVKL